MTVRHLHKVGELLAVLEEPTPEMQSVRELLKEEGHFPCRRTFERRLKRPCPRRCLGRLAAWADWLPGTLLGCAAKALDEYGTSGGPRFHRALGQRRSVAQEGQASRSGTSHFHRDTEAGWTKSGWHGWVYGWKLHLTVTVGSVWIPLSARLTPANTADNKVAGVLMESLPDEVRFVLGDTHYDDDELRKACLKDERFLVTPKRGAYPHTDAGGVEVRRIFHLLPHRTIENFNEHFKAIFDIHGQVPTKGKTNTACFALGAVFAYQLALLYRHERGLDTNRGLKPFLRAA